MKGDHRRVHKRCIEFKEVWSTALGKKVRRCARWEILGTAITKLKSVA